MDQAVQERSRGQHHGRAAKADARLRDRTANPAALEQKIVNGLLEQPQVRLVFEPAANRVAIQHAIGLRTRRAHCGALRTIQDSKLNAGFVGGGRHRAAERVDFLDQMALADAADRRIARHLTQRFQAVRQQQRLAAHARSRQRGLGSGVAAAHHNHIKTLGKSIECE